MQSVYILGNDREDLSCLFKLDDSHMGRVRPGVAESRPPFEFVIPMLDSRGFGSHEVVIIDRLTTFPHPSWSSKIRNTAAGGDSGAGERQNVCRALQVFR